MSKEELKYIFSNSACLTPKQMKHYVRGRMTNEESYAVELHLNSCPFCNEAVEGLFEQQEGNAAEAVAELSNDFLKDHFSLHNPQVHLNSMAPAHPVTHTPVKRRRKLNAQPLWRPSGIAAALLLGVIVLWYVRSGQMIGNEKLPAQAVTAAAETADAPAGKEMVNTSGERLLASAELVDVEPAVEQQLQSTAGSPVPDGTPQPVLTTGNSGQAEARATEKQPEEKKADVVVAAYKTPLIDNATPPAPRTAEKIEKMPSRTTTPVAGTADAHRSNNAKDDVYAMDGSRKETAALSADELFSQKKYPAALALYKQDMTTGSRGKRNQAAIQAARCYLAMGKKQNAIQVLQAVVDGGGPQKRAARRLLNDLQAETGE